VERGAVVEITRLCRQHYWKGWRTGFVCSLAGGLLTWWSLHG